jgi:hypothetical protein
MNSTKQLKTKIVAVRDMGHRKVYTYFFGFFGGAWYKEKN